MSCDYDRRKWWNHLKQAVETNFPEPVQDQILENLVDHIEAQVTKATRGGSGRRRRQPRENLTGTRSRSETGTTVAANPESTQATRSRAQGQEAGRAMSPPERLYRAVKQAALHPNRDWTDEERAKIVEKYLALKSLVNAHDENGEPINPAHGRGADPLPRISSLVAYAAVYDALTSESDHAQVGVA